MNFLTTLSPMLHPNLMNKSQAFVYMLNVRQALIKLTFVHTLKNVDLELIGPELDRRTVISESDNRKTKSREFTKCVQLTIPMD